MSEPLKPDICVIGGGAGGITLAASAAQLGARVVLVERGQLGGDNLYRGTIPSKALMAAANRAFSVRQTRAFGITPLTPAINFRAVGDHIQSVVNAIAPNESAERLAGFGVQVLRGFGKFDSRETVLVDDRVVAARSFVIATGSSPALPPIEGLRKVPFLTSDTLFGNSVRFEHLIVLGGSGHAMELAQAYLRLGSRVTLIARERFLPEFDPELAKPLIAKLTEEGVQLAEGVSCDRIEPAEGGGIRIHVSKDGDVDTVDGTHLLIAGQRLPNIEGLELAKAGVEHDPSGITVSNRLRTSNRLVYAIGDVTGGASSATRARHEANILVRRLVLGSQAVTQPHAVPSVIFTSPALAHVGMDENAAREKYGRSMRVLRWPFSENDRAVVERETEGYVKVVAGPSGRILGATIIGETAAELIQTWCLAVTSGLTVAQVAESIAPYPTLAETNIKTAQGFTLERSAATGLMGAMRLLPGQS